MEETKELIEEYAFCYNEWLEDEFDYPDERKADWSSFLLREKLLLKHFGLPNRKPHKGELREVIFDSVQEKEVGNVLLPRLDYSAEFAEKIIAKLEELKRLK